MGRDGEPGGQAEASGAGGELSMSIEETNKLRISLGLKPLKVEDAQPAGPSKEELAKKEEEEKAAKAEELADRVRLARERRKQQEALDRTKKLGEADAEVDDVMTWVSKSRKTDAERKEEQRRKKEAEAAARRKKQEEASSDEDEDREYPGGHSAAELAGVKVKHTAEELEAGETMILTLEDKGILDEKGHLREEDDLVLENILAREQKDRDKAWRAAGKNAKPLWEEDGIRRGLLDKYDQEEEEMMQIDEAGRAEAQAKRQEDIRARLAAGAARAAESAAVETKQAADFYTKEEMAQFAKPKKRKERKLKKKALTAEEIAALEQDAAARGSADLGSRADRVQRAQRQAAELAATEAERRQRFDLALEKANYASLALRGDDAGAGGEEAGLEEDEDLYASLSKARQLALSKADAGGAKPGPESIAEQLIRRREEQTRAAAAAALAGESGGAGLTFTDIGEFARSIQVKEEDEEAAPAGAAAGAAGGEQPPPAAAAAAEVKHEEEVEAQPVAGGRGMYGLADEEMEDAPGPSGRSAPSGGGDVWAGWVPAVKEEPTAAELKEKIKAKARAQEAREREERGEGGRQKGPVEDSVTGERAIGSGLAGALAFLKDRGELSKPVEWAGRTNDSKKVNIQGLDDVYTGGRQEDRVALDVEVALTRKDEYGRILTPKEAFRQLCHRFHGMQPSKNTRDKRAKQIAKELAQKKVASGAGEAETVEHMKQIQKQAATPYVVLSGTIKPGQSRDAASGYATVDRMEEVGAPTPVLGRLGGGQTPLVGNAKVEAMLGLKRKGSESMPPPPPKAAKRG